MHAQPTGTYLDVDAARTRVLASFSALETIEVPTLEALDMVLAEEIVASHSLPQFPNSAMDGYAVRSADLESASENAPVWLTIVGLSAAGHPSTRSVEPDSAIRIMTGAQVPDRADAVVPFEQTTERTRSGDEEDRIGVFVRVRPGQNIRSAGEDLAEGDTVLSIGAHLRPPDLGLLAAAGRSSTRVHRRPVVAILATGDEIVDPGTPLGPGQLYNSNSLTIAGQTRRAGGVPVVLGVASDSAESLHTRLAKAVGADLIVSTGGVSMGDYDFVKDALQKTGAIDLWQIRMKPGKPLAFGAIGDVPFLGLPGNPVAAAVAFAQFGRPAIRKMLGHADLDMPTIRATLADRVENRGGRRNFVRVRVTEMEPGRFVARVSGLQGSGVLSSLARANGLLVIPEAVAVAEPGMMLPVQMLDWEIG